MAFTLSSWMLRGSFHVVLEPSQHVGSNLPWSGLLGLLPPGVMMARGSFSLERSCRETAAQSMLQMLVSLWHGSTLVSLSLTKVLTQVMAKALLQEVRRGPKTDCNPPSLFLEGV